MALLQPKHNHRALLGFPLWSRGLSDTLGEATRCFGDDDQHIFHCPTELSLNVLLGRGAAMGAVVSSEALGSSEVLCKVLLRMTLRLGLMSPGMHSLSITSSPHWIRPRMHHCSCNVQCESLYMGPCYQVNFLLRIELVVQKNRRLTGRGNISWLIFFFKLDTPTLFLLSLIFTMVCQVCCQISVHHFCVCVHVCETFAAGDFPWDGLFGKSDVNCKLRLNMS